MQKKYSADISIIANNLYNAQIYIMHKLAIKLVL